MHEGHTKVIRQRAGRDTFELFALVAVLAGLEALGLTAGTPLWAYAFLGLLATGAITVAYARWPAGTGMRGLHCRMGLQAPAFLLLAYSTGWGSGLVGVLAFLVADAVKSSGARAAWVSLLWCAGATLAGQMAVAAGIAPSLIPTPGAHGLAFLGILGLALVTHRIARMAKEKDAAQANVASAQQRFRALVQNSTDVIVVLDRNNGISYVSPSAQRVFGYRPEELRERTFVSLIHRDDLAAVKALVAGSAAQPSETPVVECRLRHADGGWRHVETVVNNLLYDPDLQGVVLNTRDISDRRGLEAQLTHKVFHDELTGLANRALFTDRVEHAVARQARSGDGLAVLFCDLDGFKSVNDTLGHAAGDELLAVVAERLSRCAREVDTVARLGGDEFAILIEDQRDEHGPARFAQRLLSALSEPCEVRGAPVALTASIGIALTLGAEQTTEELLRNADIAMYKAKSSGRSRYEIFEPGMHLAVVERLRLESDLQRAVEERQFVLHYQPIVQLDCGNIVGVEALVRWRHPERGMVSPGEFIPAAEETGLIVPIGRWVLEEACRQISSWQRQYATDPLLHVSVNLSARQLTEPDIVEHVRGAFEAACLDPATLTLEITESALVRETDATVSRLTELKELGVRLAIDDFGTGYSSLSYLQRFPVDTLKIDRSFIESMERGSDPALVKAIVELGHTLRLDTVAEGIERTDQLDQFRALRCQHGQGFFFARPGDQQAISMLFARQGWPHPARMTAPVPAEAVGHN